MQFLKLWAVYIIKFASAMTFQITLIIENNDNFLYQNISRSGIVIRCQSLRCLFVCVKWGDCIHGDEFSTPTI